MATGSIKVEAQADAFLRIARARPVNAIAELVWNAVDADAANVTVYFDESDLGLSGVIVEDDGVGATPTEAREYFRRLGGSWKKPGARTKRNNRVLHGSQGQGRYKALSVGRSVSWTYFFEQNGSIHEFKLHMLGDAPADVAISEPKPSKRQSTGCIVEIREPVRQFKNLADDDTILEFTELFALYLCDYPGVHISYAGTRLDPSAAIRNQFVLPVQPVSLPSGERTDEGSLRVIEWKHLDRRSLFVCDPQGFALQQLPARFHLRKHSFSAYLQSSYLDVLHNEGRLDLAELDPLAAAVIDAAKDAVKLHYDQEEKREAARIIQEWKSSKIYPYDDEPKSDIEKVERQVFEIVAVKLQSASTDLAAASRTSKKLQLELLRHAVETGPNQLRDILSKVVDLSKREQEDLSKLLEQTTLSSIIGASKVVSDRLDFLRGLYQLVYEYEGSGRIKERSQLHRIIAQNPWLFGEEYVVSTDDRDLSAVLKAHKKFLGDDIVIDEPVRHVSQQKGVVDLMLSRLLRRHRPNEVEHLVVELKRPGVPVGTNEITQINQYAASVEADGRFATREGLTWTYWVISDRLDKMGKWQVDADKTGRGLIRDTPSTKIYVRTWDQLIEENKARYQFIQERLNFTASDERAMSYLRNEYASFLEGVTVKSDSVEAA